MNEEPDSLAEADLISALADGWGIKVTSSTYLPVGFGSYHWSVVDETGTSRFVTVDDLGRDGRERAAAFEALGQAFGTALALRRDARLEFVVAPLPTRTGSAVWRLDDRFAVSTFPMVDGVAGGFGPHRRHDLAQVLELLVELHRATPIVADLAGRVDLALPGRDRLQEALATLSGPWFGGPYSEPARHLLASRADHIVGLLHAFDRLVAQARQASGDWLITHGEPHPGNVIRTADGLRLIDWDTARIAPPERDLWLLADGADGTEEVLAEYTRLTGRPVDPAAIAMFRMRWELADIVIYVDEFRQPHRASADIDASWTYLTRYLNPTARQRLSG